MDRQEKKLRILILEDLSTDVELLERELRNGLGMEFETMAVDNGEDFKKALSQFSPHVILSDYLLPTYSGMDALRLAQRVCPTVPFIIVTGSTNELTAVDCIKAGAWDYCIKEKLSRLIPSIRGALQKKALMEEAQRIQSALHASEAQFKTMIEIAPVGVCVVGMDERIRFINKAALDMSGAKGPGEVVGRSIYDFIHKDSLRLVKDRVVRLKKKMPVEPAEEKFIGIDGRRLIVKLNSVPVRFQGEDAFLSIFHDITREKELFQRYHAILEHTTNAVFLVKDGSFEFVNPKFIELFGYTEKELKSSNFHMLNLVAPESKGAVKEKVKLFEAGETGGAVFEFTGITKDGKRLFCEATTKVILLDGLHTVLGIIRDKTQEKKTLDKVRKLSTAVEQNPLSILITDKSGAIEYVNPAFTKITGYTQGEVVGENPGVLKSGLTPKKTYEDLWQTILSGKTWHGEFINKKKDGTIFYEEALISPILNEAGEITHFLAVKEDITEKRALEERVRQAQKMEAIGTLAGGIAHDFNNLLMPIMGYAELATRLLDNGHPAKKYMEEILKASKRAKELVQQILTFSRNHKTERRPIDMVPTVKETLKLMRAAIPSTIRIEESFQCEDALILGDPVELHQVLMNLCINAKHAMPAGGTLTVTLKREYVERPDTTLNPPLKKGHYAVLTVKDTGVGIEKGLIPRIFDPYFTTKEMTRGTGLGLAVVYGIITRANGSIRVESEPGKGTAFHCYFPLENNEKPHVDPGKDSALLKGDNEHILLVDDEPLVARLGQEILERMGYRVKTFLDPTEAIEAFQRGPSSFDLVISDMTMPGMTGDELVARLREIRPDIPVVISTGFSEKMDEKRAKELQIDLYIQKPYSPSTLSRGIREILDKKQNCSQT